MVGTIPTYIVYDTVTQCFGEPLSGAMRFSQEPNSWLHSLHCRLFPGFEAAVNPLERRASSTIDACEQRQHAQARQQRRGKPLYSSAQRLRRARAACNPAIALYDDVALLLEWLGCDIQCGRASIRPAMSAGRVRDGRASGPGRLVPASA